MRERHDPLLPVRRWAWPVASLSAPQAIVRPVPAVTLSSAKSHRSSRSSAPRRRGRAREVLSPERLTLSCSQDSPASPVIAVVGVAGVLASRSARARASSACGWLSIRATSPADPRALGGRADCRLGIAAGGGRLRARGVAASYVENVASGCVASGCVGARAVRRRRCGVADAGGAGVTRGRAAGAAIRVDEYSNDPAGTCPRG